MAARIKILFVEDDPNDLELIQYELKKGNIDFEANHVLIAGDFEKALRNFKPDIILSDFNLPTFSGPAAFELREMIAPRIPFIIVSGAIGEINAVDLIKQGVTDCVHKDRLFSLCTKVKRALLEVKEKEQKNSLEKRIKKSEKSLKIAQGMAKLGNWELELTKNRLTWSDEIFRIFEIDPSQFEATYEAFLNSIHPDDREAVNMAYSQSLKDKQPYSIDHRLLMKDGRIKYVHEQCETDFDSKGNALISRGTVQDISVRKHSEKLQLLSNEVLTVLNNELSLKDTINQVINTIQHETNYSAVGMRLKQGEDFPYFEHTGFSKGFLYVENSLILKDRNNKICRDANGKPNMECTCGLVLTEKTDHNNPYLTKAGSFYTNDSRPLLQLTPEQEPRLHPRNTCIHLGYNSVAIIPIRVNKETIGTLQLNDKKKNAFTPETISFFEGLCLSIGTLLMRKKAEEALIEREKFLKETQRIATLGSYTLDVASGTWTSSEILDDIFGIDAGYNKSLEGWVAIIHPEWQKTMNDYFINEVLGNKTAFDKEYKIVRQNDRSERWLHGLGNLKFDENNTVISMVGTIKDITKRKLAEIALKEKVDEMTRYQSITVGRELAMIELKKEINELLRKAGQEEKYVIVE